jgi:hypothetical protein
MFQPVTWSSRPGTWLYVTAILELVLAGVFAVVGFLNETLRFGFYPTAAILGGLAFLVLLWARRMRRGYQEAQRLKAHGLPGQARIVGMRQTGAYLNEQPQIELNLEVTTSMQGPYPVVVKEWVPLMLLGRLSSGMPLPVKVDPANPQNLVIEWESSMSAPGGMGVGMTLPAQADTSQYAPAAREAEKARFLATGGGQGHTGLGGGHRPGGQRGPPRVRPGAHHRGTGPTTGAGPRQVGDPDRPGHPAGAGRHGAAQG